MDISEDRFVIYIKNFTSLLGFWYTQTFRERVIRTCIISFMLLYSVLAQLCQLFTLEFDLRSIIFVLQMFIPCVCTISVYYAIALQLMKVHEAILGAVQDYLELKDEVELKIMQKYINESKLFTKICGSMFYFFVCSTVFPFFLRIITSKTKTTYNTDRYPMFSCFDYFLGQENYCYPVVIYQFITQIVVATAAMVCYSLYFWAIQYVCARLCIVKNKIHRQFQHDQHNNNVHKKPQDLSDWTINIIQHLSKTKKFMTLMNKLGEKAYLFQMLMAFLLIIIDFLCMLEMPLLMQQKETRKDAFAFLFFVVDTVLAIYLNCYIGQKLMDCSAAVYEEICLMPFHDISVRTQKLLLTVLTMNAKPCEISIGKMFVSSHEFFSEMLRVSLSFAMVVHSTRQL